MWLNAVDEEIILDYHRLPRSVQWIASVRIIEKERARENFEDVAFEDRWCLPWKSTYLVPSSF